MSEVSAPEHTDWPQSNQAALPRVTPQVSQSTTPGLWPTTALGIWRLLNPAVTIERNVVRLLFCILAVAFTFITMARGFSGGLDLIAVRLLIVLVALIGATFAHRLNFLQLRLYAVVTALLVAVGTSYIEAARGYRPGDLALTTVASFAILPFLLTASDLLLTDLFILAGNGLVLAAASHDLGSSPDAIWTAIVAGMGAGTAVGVLLIGYRSRTYESLEWWRESFERERVLREVAERASEDLREQEASARRLAEERGQLAEMRTRFISMTSHEFRTPLTAILAANETLGRYGDRMTVEERQDKVEKISRQVDAMTRLLDDLLVLGRAESGRLPFAPEPLDLEHFCRGIVGEVHAIRQDGHQIVLSVADADRTFAGDPALLRKIISNLLANAVKYSPNGRRVEMEVSRTAASVVLRVRDHGMGIPAEDMKDLFEPFHRASNVGAIPGTGLGLAVTQKAVEAHGGTISVRSTVGRGTTFEVTLPDRP